MHPTLEELLALRDGDGTASAARHVEQCESCRAELAELRAAAHALKELPSLPPPGEAWAEICQRTFRQRRTATMARVALVAASVAVGAAVVLVTRFGAIGEDPGVAMAGDTREAIEHLSSASRDLEMILQESSLQTCVLSPRRAAMIVELEDRIALVDLALSRQTEREPGERAVALWSDRVELLDALVTVRSGDLRSDGVTYADNRYQGSQ